MAQATQINIAARIRAVGEGTGNYSGKTPIRKVRCQGCGGYIFSDKNLDGVEYVKTKRGSELFFHTECIGNVWKRGIV